MKEQNEINPEKQQRIAALEKESDKACHDIWVEKERKIKSLEKFYGFCKKLAIVGAVSAVVGVGSCTYDMSRIPEAKEWVRMNRAQEAVGQFNFIYDHGKKLVDTNVAYSTPELKEKIEQTALKQAEFRASLSNLVESYNSEIKSLRKSPSCEAYLSEVDRATNPWLSLFLAGLSVVGLSAIAGGIGSFVGNYITNSAHERAGECYDDYRRKIRAVEEENERTK